MKLQYLGTGAAEGVPAIFCDCETCRMARKRGGRNIRTRAQALIDDTLLLDLGPDTLWHSIAHGIDLTHIEHCLITHTHEDHLDPHNLAMRRRGFANLAPDTKPLCVRGSEAVGAFLGAGPDGAVNPDGSVYFRPLAPLTPTHIGGYEVTALPASHGTEQPYNYIIRSLAEDKSVLYAHDTAPWEDAATWDDLAALPRPFSLVSFDCTFGASPDHGSRHHMCLTQNIALRDRLAECGAIDEKTLLICNHFSHNGAGSLYDIFSKTAEAQGFLTSYDGMTVHL